MPGELRLRPIRAADDPATARIIRAVMTEHGAVGAGYSIEDPEVDAMSVAYAAADARYWVVVGADDAPVGCGGFARLSGTTREEATCELRKMYFLPQARGKGLGREMLERAIREAREAGYGVMYLETLATMEDAQRLYRAAGFRPLCAPRGKTGHGRCDRWFALELR